MTTRLLTVNQVAERLSLVERGYLQPDPSVLNKIKDALKTGEPHMNGGVALSLAKCDCEEAVKLPWDWE